LRLGSFLGEELKLEMKQKVEAEQEEAMNKAMASLKKIDSKDATKLIRSRLLNKDVPPHKIEA
jgi:hypothetical protein